MNDDSAVPSTVSEIAVEAAEAARLQVLDTDWAYGDHRLDLIAAANEEVLLVTEVWVMPHGSPGGLATSLDEGRLRQAMEAGRAWISQHGTTHTQLWAVVVTAGQGSGARFVTGACAVAEVG